MFSTWLTDKQKLLYCLISSLCANNWTCYATNKYLWEKLWVHHDTISWHVSRLAELWYITTEQKQLYERIITLVGGVGENTVGGRRKHRVNNNIIYNITEIDNLELNNKYKNELYIIWLWMKLWMWFDKQEIENECIRIKSMLSEYIPRKEDWKIDRAIARSYANWRFEYWNNPPKWKKKPTYFKTSLRNNIEMRSKPYAKK